MPHRRDGRGSAIATRVGGMRRSRSRHRITARATARFHGGPADVSGHRSLRSRDVWCRALDLSRPGAGRALRSSRGSRSRHSGRSMRPTGISAACLATRPRGYGRGTLVRLLKSTRATSCRSTCSIQGTLPAAEACAFLDSHDPAQVARCEARSCDRSSPRFTDPPTWAHASTKAAMPSSASCAIMFSTMTSAV